MWEVGEARSGAAVRRGEHGLERLAALRHDTGSQSHDRALGTALPLVRAVTLEVPSLSCEPTPCTLYFSRQRRRSSAWRFLMIPET